MRVHFLARVAQLVRALDFYNVSYGNKKRHPNVKGSTPFTGVNKFYFILLFFFYFRKKCKIDTMSLFVVLVIATDARISFFSIHSSASHFF